MEQVKIYQIGLGSVGRYGFDRLVEISREFEEVELCGVCDRDFERLEKAEKFAEVNNIDVETFQSTDELYREAEKNDTRDSKILVYDAGPAETHSDKIYRSMQHDFFHLAEKPPSMNRGEHIKEKRLAEKGKAMWTADFIERESPVVKKAVELVEGKNIESIEVFRESSVGIEKAIDRMARFDVKGGDILDKMVNEVYVLDLLEAAGENIELVMEDAETRFFQPKSMDSGKFADIYSGQTEDISYETATAMTQASFEAGKSVVELHSSWMGLSEESMLQAQQIEDKTGHTVYEREYSEMNEQAYVNEEARFFVIEGEENLVGDMLHGKLFDLETGEEIEVPELLHDQLYRVLEKAVFFAEGRDVEIVPEEEIDVFMNAIFDVKEEVSRGERYYEELSNAKEKLEKLTVSDGKIIEAETSETVAG